MSICNNNNNNNLRLFNKICKETNVIYHNYASSKGISDTTFWILYSIYYYGEGSLRLIYVRSGSTVPRLSILPLNPWNKKDLSLSSLLLKAKNKQIFFTDTGRSLAEELVLPVIKAEEQSFTGLDKKNLRLCLMYLSNISDN